MAWTGWWRGERGKEDAVGAADRFDSFCTIRQYGKRIAAAFVRAFNKNHFVLLFRGTFFHVVKTIAIASSEAAA